MLFSCPGDAYVACHQKIRDAVDNFNTYANSALSIHVDLTHWTTDSYPQSGGSPQDLLNNQIVDEADVAVAVFWTRFGSPTDKYKSGTEEEIKRLISNNKQVFLYFLDKPVSPSQTDTEQYREQRKLISEFRSRCEKLVLYSAVEDEEKLQEQFAKHLFLYFANQVNKISESVLTRERSSLLITAVDSSTELSIKHLDLTHEFDIEALSVTIIEKIKEVCKFNVFSIINERIPVDMEKTSNEDAKNVSAFNSSTINKILPSYSQEQKAKISDEEKKYITDFCSENGIELNQDFFELGNLILQTNTTSRLLGQEPSLKGSEAEENKFTLLKEVVIDVCRYFDLSEYCANMDKLPFVELVIKNTGTAYDEEIEITLKLANGKIIPQTDFPSPIFDIEDINESNCIPKWLSPMPTIDIDEYCYSSTFHAHNYLTPIPVLPFQTTDYKEEYENEKEQYRNSIEDLYQWSIFQDPNGDVLKINIDKLNQFKSMHLPARLFFEVIPDKIEYRITAKHTPNVIQGTILVKQNKVKQDA
jgi:hypothetical protein